MYESMWTSVPQEAVFAQGGNADDTLTAAAVQSNQTAARGKVDMAHNENWFLLGAPLGGRVSIILLHLRR
jgi:hypothetical protein